MFVERMFKSVEMTGSGDCVSLHPSCDFQGVFRVGEVTWGTRDTSYMFVTDKLEVNHVERVYTEGGLFLEGLGLDVCEMMPPIPDPCASHTCSAFMPYRRLSIFDACRIAEQIRTLAFKVTTPLSEVDFISLAAPGIYSLEYRVGECTRPNTVSMGIFVYLSPASVLDACRGLEDIVVLAGTALAPVASPPKIPYPSEMVLDHFYSLRPADHYLPPFIAPSYTADEFCVERALTLDEFLEEYERW